MYDGDQTGLVALYNIKTRKFDNPLPWRGSRIPKADDIGKY